VAAGVRERNVSRTRPVFFGWDGSQLILQADNDFDSTSLALLDEFSDAISACIEDGFDGGIDIVSVSPLPRNPPPDD
jgi:hypothetical protein